VAKGHCVVAAFSAMTPFMASRILGSVNDLERYQVGNPFSYLATNAGVSVQSCFLAVTSCVGQAERGGR
jgi:hypothetical protein